MPRYLFHSSDATYDAASKTYTFTIEKRVPNAKSLTINRFGYTASTAASYPHAVYVRSDAITGLIKVKHAMEVTSAGHEDQSNVVAVLEEAHGIGRYQLDRGRHRYPLVRFHNQTTIDFQFTNGSTVLAGVYAPAVTPGITAADIDALYDAGSVVLWVDMAYPGAVRDANQDDADLGESVVDVKARKPDPFGAVTFLTSGLDKIQKVSFGAHGAMAVTGQVGSSWQYLLDSNNTDNPADLVVGSYIFLMRTPPTRRSTRSGTRGTSGSTSAAATSRSGATPGSTTTSSRSTRAPTTSSRSSTTSRTTPRATSRRGSPRSSRTRASSSTRLPRPTRTSPPRPRTTSASTTAARRPTSRRTCPTRSTARPRSRPPSGRGSGRSTPASPRASPGPPTPTRSMRPSTPTARLTPGEK